MWWQICVCSLAILLLAPCSLSEKFSLAGSPHPVVGVVGQDVVLPCQLSPPAQPPSMHVWWRKIGTGFIPVHEYSDKGTQDLPGESYRNRTELFLQEFSSGNVSLKLKRLQVADDGKYQCFVKNPEWSREAITELRVAAVAPVFIVVLGPQGQGIGLDCRSAGWFPKPELHWVGKNLTMETVTSVTQDRGNLYTVVSHITVTEADSNGDISCIVRNGLLQTEQKSAIHLSGDIFPRVSPWLAVFWVLFTLNLIAIGACACLGYKAKQKVSKKKSSEEETLFIRDTEKAALVSECKDLRERLGSAVTELDFRRARSYMVPVTLDPSYTYPELTVSADGRTVQYNPPSLEPAALSGTLIAVGREEFTMRDHDGKAGVCRWYWEVEVGDNPDWELGVLSEAVRGRVRQERLERPTQEGFWALGRSDGQYHPMEADVVIQTWGVKPTVIGVYLDLGARSLSFYSVNGMSLILEIPVKGYDGLFPFLIPGFGAGRDKVKPFRICPPSDWDFIVSQGNFTSAAQSLASNNGEGAGNNTGPSTTGERASAPGKHPAPADQGVKGNSTEPSGIKIFGITISIPKRNKGNKTEQEHLQEKGGKKHQSPKSESPPAQPLLPKAHQQGKGNQKEKH